jgi:hypothetical protein
VISEYLEIMPLFQFSYASIEALLLQLHPHPHFLTYQYHTKIGKEALSRDIHALLEKPGDIYAEKVKEISDLASTSPLSNISI